MRHPRHKRLLPEQTDEEVWVHAVETQCHTIGNHYQYKLREIATEDGYVYCKIQKGMCGLPQAGIIAQDLLQACLAKVGYHQSKIIPGLWTHETRKTCFTLVIDDFAIKYTSMEDAQHLIDALKKGSTITIDWDAAKLDLPLNGTTRTKRSMPLCQDIFKRHYFDSSTKHQTPKTKQNSPHPHVKPQYGAKAQYATNKDTYPPPHRQGGKICTRSSRHITLLCQSSEQHNPPSTQCNCHQASKSNRENESNSKTTVRLLCNAGQSGTHLQSKQNDSCSTQWCRTLQQKEIKEPSKGAFFLSNDNEFPPNSGAILTVATIIKAVMSSAAEAELGALYLSIKEAACLWKIIAKMGHPQPHTPIQTNNLTVEGVINHKIQPKQTKVMDMHFHWLHDHEAQGRYRIN